MTEGFQNGELIRDSIPFVRITLVISDVLSCFGKRYSKLYLPASFIYMPYASIA